MYVSLDYRTPFVLQERAFHSALSIARRLISETTAALQSTSPGEAPAPFRTHERIGFHSGPYATVKGGGATYILQAGCYSPSFVVHEDDDGAFGYFVASHSYYDGVKGLAASLLRMIMPDRGIGILNKAGYGEIPIHGSVEGLRDIATACFMRAANLKSAFEKEIEQLQWKGQPSSFLDEDDDARDQLLAEMRAGATILAEPIDNAGYKDVDGVWRYYDADGAALSIEIVERLIAANAIHREDGRYGKSPVLIANMNAPEHVITPRKNCVRFQTFQSYCSSRRHDGYTECAHRAQRNSDQCSESSCPIVIQVYGEDFGDWFERRVSEDPAFEDRWDHDPLVRAMHRNTERSFAWKASGEHAISVVVNQTLHAKFSMGANHLFGSEHLRAVREAVALGHLDVIQEMDGMGVVVAPSAALIAHLEAQAPPTGLTH